MNKFIILIFFLIFSSIYSLNLKQDPTCEFNPIPEPPKPTPIPEGDNSNGDAKGDTQDI